MRWYNIWLYVSALLLVFVGLAAFREIRDEPPLEGSGVPETAPELVLGPFNGVEMAKLGARERLLVARIAQDFELVRAGKPPACKHTSVSAFSDGGTAIYECPGYTLTVMKSLFSLGENHGYLYGPVATLEGDKSVSDVRFYSSEALERILSPGGGR